MLVSHSGIGYNTDGLITRDCNRVKRAGWNLTLYGTVLTLLYPFPNQILFVDKSKQGI